MTAALNLTEAALQAQVVELARRYQWLVYHTFDSRHSMPGFPDLVLVRGIQLVFAELKTETGRIRPEQTEWIDALNRVATVFTALVDTAIGDMPELRDRTPQILVAVWRPSDWPEIERVLGRRPTRGQRKAAA